MKLNANYYRRPHSTTPSTNKLGCFLKLHGSRSQCSKVGPPDFQLLKGKRARRYNTVGVPEKPQGENINVSIYMRRQMTQVILLMRSGEEALRPQNRLIPCQLPTPTYIPSMLFLYMAKKIAWYIGPRRAHHEFGAVACRTCDARTRNAWR